jgi:hypothetical protein
MFTYLQPTDVSWALYAMSRSENGLQMKNMPDIHEKYEINDIIYHYTKLNTALEHILDTRIDGRTLRLSPRKHSIDPWEKYEEYLPMIFDFENSDINVDDDRISSLYNDFKGKLEISKQVCFCKNNNNHRLKTQESHQSKQSLLGYLKARMWERYADNFNGVCLAFDQIKLKSNNPSFSVKSIKYKRFQNLPERTLRLKLSELSSTDGLKRIKSSFTKKLNDILYSKYYDYRDENELRFYSFSEYEYDYLNISGALKGVFLLNNT